MTATTNLLADLPAHLSAEIFHTLVSGDNFRLERIVSLGHASPPGFWYDQEQHEWVLVLQGAAQLQFAGQEQLVEMRPGDALLIPAHQRHRVEWTDPQVPTVWLALHYHGLPPVTTPNEQ